jgi:hypothetical protein
MRNLVKTFSRIYVALFVVTYVATKIHAFVTYGSGNNYIEEHWKFWITTLAIAILGGLADRFGSKPD